MRQTVPIQRSPYDFHIIRARLQLDFRGYILLGPVPYDEVTTPWTQPIY